MIDLNSMTLSELKDLAKENNIKNISKLKKENLIAVLHQVLNTNLTSNSNDIKEEINEEKHHYDINGEPIVDYKLTTDGDEIVEGILDILPYVGTIIVFIPIIIYNIVVKKYLIVIGMISLYILSQLIREILELKFLSSKLEIHPLAIMLSIYIGAEIFGVIGILVGPIYCLVAKDILYG